MLNRMQSNKRFMTFSWRLVIFERESKACPHSIKLWAEWLGVLRLRISMLTSICCFTKIFRLDKRCKAIRTHSKRKPFFSDNNKSFQRSNREDCYCPTENAVPVLDRTASDPRLRFYKNFPGHPVACEAIGIYFQTNYHRNFAIIFLFCFLIIIPSSIRWKIARNERKSWRDLRPVNFKTISNSNVT